MKIAKVETFTYWAEWCNWLFVKVTTDDGLHGWGEGSLHGAVTAVDAAIAELTPTLIDLELDRGPASIWAELYNAWRWRGGPVMSTAVGALDIALWDLEGKRLGVPVYRLLGGPFRTRVRAYASHWLPDVASEEEAFTGAKQAVGRGFSAFKWNPFRASAMRENQARALSRAADLMAAAREGAGDECDIFIDCSECFSPRTAIAAAEALAPFRPGWFEEPLPFENLRQLADLQRRIPVPIATGERLLSRFAYREVLETGACQVAQPDVMHAAGITEVMRIATMADTYLVSVAPHNPGGPICTAASLHVAAATPNFYILEQMEDERALRDSVSTPALAYADGYYSLPEAPGLGVELDIELLSSLAQPFKPQPLSRMRDSRWF